ncbi:MAG: sigma-54 dependent transcriptional regulator, partial [Myxococcales bacterium]|nr:sigma-54 dependent transcriptional regulator [Myxococcales bacterium]
LNSTNGTQVCGNAVQRAEVSPGEELRFGAVRASLHLMSPQLQHGVEGYDELVTRIEDELQRASAFGRTFCILMLKATAAGQSHYNQWFSLVASALREVDRVGMYDATSLLVLLPETGAEHVRALASQLAHLGKRAGLTCSGAVYPHAATSVEQLIARTRELSVQATCGQPAIVADQGDHAARTGEVIVLSPCTLELHRLAKRVASKNVTLLITGETGTGKEVLAAAIHRWSGRRGSLRAINCAAIPRGLTESVLFGHEKGAFSGAHQRSGGVFEDADGGTLLLDEVGELSDQAQAALLRVLQTGVLTRVGSTQEIRVDVRVLAATHRDLEEMARAGRFREDLLYRLNVITLAMPPLRERCDEIGPLAELFLRQVAAEWGTRDCYRLSEEARSALAAYSWPGNVRQLRNVVERAAALCADNVVTQADLGDRLQAPGPKPSAASDARSGPHERPSGPFKERIRAYEIGLIREGLERAEGNMTRAAELLGMPVRTLTYKLKSYGLSVRR